MIKHSIAIRYAKALFEQDLSKEQLERRQGDFEALLSLLRNNPKLIKFLKQPQVLVSDKKQILYEALKDRFDSTFLNFLFHLLEKGRWGSLAKIAEYYREMVDEYLGLWKAKIATAIPIGNEVEKKLTAKLENYYRKKVQLSKEINPVLMGGAVLEVSNESIDWSVSNRLKKLKEELLKSTV